MGLLPDGAKRDGEVLFRGQDIFSLSPKAAYRLRGRELGMIFQEPLTRLNPLMRISQHFEETIKQHEPELSKERDPRAGALDVLRLMGIPPTRYRSYPHEFSGRHAPATDDRAGARAAARRSSWRTSRRPRSTYSSRRRSSRILNDLRRNFQTSLLLITHNVGIVAEACDRVAVMYAGRIVEQGNGRGRSSRIPSTPTPASCSARRSRCRPPG